ncbi:ribosomal RNA large subunit methyltransferase E [mine drainage metagenome]|uniref:Ribosomal RNA large subunit methyltransferase E n=1 Tax=mine drainage metagenome TaxID=410659 RepID=A0A1J5RI33_9ZZZZ
MKKNRFKKAWLNEHLHDPFVKLAQKENFRSRAVYKLKEIDEANKLIRPGQVIVDLGSAPGAWSQYLGRKLAGEDGSIRGTVIALDLLPMEPVDGVQFIQGDFREAATLAQLEAALRSARVDVVLSDMAPNLSGIASADAARIEHLADLSLDFARNWLKADGALLIKSFHTGYFSQIVNRFKLQFKIVKTIKPKASRDRSAEVFILGLQPKSTAELVV